MRKTKKSKTVPIHVSEEAVCKICLDNSPELLSPCKCSGTMQFVHEDCLKTWILAKQGEIEEAKCELCMKRYRMEYELSTVCICHEIICSNASRCMIGPLLFCIEGMVVLMIYLLIDKFQEDSSDRARVFSLILIIICSVAALILLFLGVFVIKQLCFVKKLKRWSILNHVTSSKQDESTVIMHNQPLFVEREHLIVPPRVNVRGVSVIPPSIPRFQRTSSGSQLLAVRDLPSELNVSHSQNQLECLREDAVLSEN